MSTPPFRRGDRVTLHHRVPPFRADDIIVLDAIEKVGRGRAATWRAHGVVEGRDASGWLYADDLALVRNPPGSLTRKGERMYQAVKSSSTAASPAAVVYSAAARGVPGLVTTKFAREHGYPTSNPASGYRIFQGKDTNQIDGVTGKPALRRGWYFEPDDYEGDTLYSRAMASEEEAIIAAQHSAEAEES